MIKVISRAAMATAIRAATSKALGRGLPNEHRVMLEEALVKEVLSLSVDVEPPKMVPLSEHELLQMKYNTALQMLELYKNADVKRQTQTEVRTRCGISIPQAPRH